MTTCWYCIPFTGSGSVHRRIFAGCLTEPDFISEPLGILNFCREIPCVRTSERKWRRIDTRRNRAHFWRWRPRWARFACDASQARRSLAEDSCDEQAYNLFNSVHVLGFVCILPACSEPAQNVSVANTNSSANVNDANLGHTDSKAASETVLSGLTDAVNDDLNSRDETLSAIADIASAGDSTSPDSGSELPPACIPKAELCNGKDDNCNGKTDEGLEELVCGVGECSNGVAACIKGVAQVCEPLQPQKESCNNLDDDCDGKTDNGLAALTCGIGACAVTTSACVNGKPQKCTAAVAQAESCNGIDDDCDGKTDEDNALCPKGGESCINGACKTGCQLAGATACPADTFCSVGDDTLGQCLPAGSACLVTASPTPCGANTCGPGTICHPQLLQCLADAPCNGVICSGGSCYGNNCPCTRPAPGCKPADLAAMNAAAFSYGVVDIDMDLQCGLWGVTVLNGTDYLRHLTPDGKVQSVGSVGNLDMNEVAALQGFGSVFGGQVVEAALTYGCCNGCGCSSNLPKGVAWYDKANNKLPMMLPTNAALAGTGPFWTLQSRNTSTAAPQA